MATLRASARATALLGCCLAVGLLTACSGTGPSLAGGGSACCPPPTTACAPPVETCAPPCAPVAAAPSERPPNAAPGEVWCYVRVPAVTRTVCEQVCVQEQSCRQEWVPPEYETVCEQVCVRQAETRRIPIPAQYETVCEQVMTCPAKSEWRRVDCQAKTLAEGEQLGDCWTLVEVPPVYETRSRQVCVQPESCREECIPAEYETRERQVCSREGFYKSIDVPPVYETVTREEVICGPRWEWRRTTECEVPGGAYVGDPYAAGAVDPYAGAMPGATAPGVTDPYAGSTPGMDGVYGGEPAGLPPVDPYDGAAAPELPAGELGPVDPFAPAR